MNWAREGKYGLRCGDWRIGKYFKGNVILYQLWHNLDSKGFFDSAEEAKDAAEAAQ